MELMHMLLHVDQFLLSLVNILGAWSYVVLFLIVFFERGCILTPFLPGDSLLFATGVLAANSTLNIAVLVPLLSTACFLATLVNYYLGAHLGKYIDKRTHQRWFNRKHLDRTRVFFDKYGTMAIILSCFIPIIRTFTPFVAGMARMNKATYLIATIVASLVWVAGILVLSYVFGNMPFVKDHFSLFVLALLIIPAVIPVVAYFKRS